MIWLCEGWGDLHEIKSSKILNFIWDPNRPSVLHLDILTFECGKRQESANKLAPLIKFFTI